MPPRGGSPRRAGYEVLPRSKRSTRLGWTPWSEWLFTPGNSRFLGGADEAFGRGGACDTLSPCLILEHWQRSAASPFSYRRAAGMFPPPSRPIGPAATCRCLRALSDHGRLD